MKNKLGNAGMNKKKREIKQEIQEIREILLGHIVQQENGRLASAEAGKRQVFQGVRNGWGSVRIFGIGHKTWLYTHPEDAGAEEARTAFLHVGRAIDLISLPDIPCCLCVSGMLTPVLLVAEHCEGEEDRQIDNAGEQNVDEQGIGQLKITAYSGRSPLLILRRLWLLRKTEKYLPESFVRVQKTEAEDSENTEDDEQSENGQNKAGQGGSKQAYVRAKLVSLRKQLKKKIKRF